MSIRPARFALAALLASLLGDRMLPSADAAEPPTFWSVAQPVPRVAGMPKYDDVVFSIRWQRPRCNLSHARSFHANRIEWSYILDYDWARDVVAKGYHLSGSIVSSLPDDVPVNMFDRDPDAEPAMTFEIGRLVGKDGDVEGPAHLAAMGHKVGCYNNPKFRELVSRRVVDMAKAGVHGIQCDGPSGSWGDVVSDPNVCFCSYCVRDAKRRKADINDKQTRSLIQRRALRQFYTAIMEDAHEVNPDIVFSKNVHVPQWYEELFDYEFAELDASDGIEPAEFLKLRQREDGPDRFQIYTLRSDNVRQNQDTIALAYATGSLVSAPYDVYPADGYKTRERFYGKDFHFAPQYAMVRGVGELLDGYEDAFGQFDGPEDPRWPILPARMRSVTDEAVNDQLAMFIRAKPGQPDAGLVVHCLERLPQKDVAGLQVQFREADLTPIGDAPQFTYYQMPEYDASAHAKAETEALRIGQEAGSLTDPKCRTPYRDLVVQTELDASLENGVWTIKLPAFNIHSILHIH